MRTGPRGPVVLSLSGPSEQVDALRGVLVGKRVPPHGPFHREGLTGQVAAKLLLLVERAPDAVDPVAEELIGVDLAGAEVGGDDEGAVGGEERAGTRRGQRLAVVPTDLADRIHPK